MTDVKHTAHTAGPWIVEYDTYDEALHVTSQARLDGDKVEIAKVSVGYSDAFETEQQANARLIAAAPVMFSALDQHPDPADFADAEAYRNATNEWWDMFGLPAINAARETP